MQRIVDPKIIDDSSECDSDDDGSAAADDELDTLIGPMPPNTTSLSELPIDKEASLGDQHQSYVSCISLETSGNRLVTGSLDTTVKFWDFNAMTRSLQPFQTISPLDDASLRTVTFSATGSLISMAGGSNSAIITDRDGRTLAQTAKGDMYLVDALRTIGHTSSIFSTQWSCANSKFPNTTFATVAGDSTLRLWDAGHTERVAMSKFPVISQQRVIKIRTDRGAKATPTAMLWHPNGNRIVLGCVDGRLRIYDLSSHSPSPSIISEPFAPLGTETTCVASAPGGCSAPYILVRSKDDALHVFDERSLKTSVKTFNDLPNTVSETDVVFIGKTGSFFATGTSKTVEKDGEKHAGALHMYDTSKLQPVWKSERCDERGSVVSILWHERLNQIVYGTGDGKVHVMYHPSKSQRGILQCMTKTQQRKRHGIAAVSDTLAIPGDSFQWQRGQSRSISSITGNVAQAPKRARRGPTNSGDGNA